MERYKESFCCKFRLILIRPLGNPDDQIKWWYYPCCWHWRGGWYCQHVGQPQEGKASRLWPDQGHHCLPPRRQWGVWVHSEAAEEKSSSRYITRYRIIYEESILFSNCGGEPCECVPGKHCGCDTHLGPHLGVHLRHADQHHAICWEK